MLIFGVSIFLLCQPCLPIIFFTSAYFQNTFFCKLPFDADIRFAYCTGSKVYNELYSMISHADWHSVPRPMLPIFFVQLIVLSQLNFLSKHWSWCYLFCHLTVHNNYLISLKLSCIHPAFLFFFIFVDTWKYFW